MTYPDEYSYLKEPRYWIEDVYSKAEEMAAYLEAIREDIPRAEKYYKAFKAKSRKENLQYLKVNLASFCYRILSGVVACKNMQ